MTEMYIDKLDWARQRDNLALQNPQEGKEDRGVRQPRVQ